MEMTSFAIIVAKFISRSLRYKLDLVGVEIVRLILNVEVA